MLTSEDFRKGDVFLDYPFERAKFRYVTATHKVYRRFYGDTEREVPWSDELFIDAVRSGKRITRDEYYRD